MQESSVKVFATTPGENRDAFEFVLSLQQIVDLDIRVAIVTVFYLATLSKHCVRFIEKKDRSSIAIPELCRTDNQEYQPGTPP
jgi:hypothetical protein